MDATLTPPIDWTGQLAEQLDWHWRGQLRPRLDGLNNDQYPWEAVARCWHVRASGPTTDESRWEPVAGCWNVRPRGTSTAPMAAGGGAFTIDFAFPEPDPAP